MKSNKNRNQRSEEQKTIATFFEFLQQAINVRDFELGDGKNVPKFVRHDGYNYSVTSSDGTTIRLQCTLETMKE